MLEIDGASNRGIDEIRQLRQNVAVRPSRARFKIYIIDEVHMLTKEAFNALLKTLEEPPEHVKFIFATTEAEQDSDHDPVALPAVRFRRHRARRRSRRGSRRSPRPRASRSSRKRCRSSPAGRPARCATASRCSSNCCPSAGERITADDVNRLLGIAPAERLSGLVGSWWPATRRPPSRSWTRRSPSGVEVGQLLDQLVGYFRDVMTAAVGCTPDQMLYALPSQAAEVAEIGRQLGLQTMLAIGQILDQTAARMRVSMHGRTLVEMAIVRICQLGDLDELADLIAELRGRTQASQRRGHGASRSAGRTPTDYAPGAIEPAKKNIEPPPRHARSPSRWQSRKHGSAAARIAMFADQRLRTTTAELPRRRTARRRRSEQPRANGSPPVDERNRRGIGSWHNGSEH